MSPQEASALEPQDRVVFDPDNHWIDAREIKGHTPNVGDTGFVIYSTVEMPDSTTLKYTVTVRWDKEGPAQRMMGNPATASTVPGLPTQLQSTLPSTYLKRAPNKPSVEFKRKLDSLRKKRATPFDSKNRQIIQPRVLFGDSSGSMKGTTSGRFTASSLDSSPLTVEGVTKLMEELKKNASKG